MANKKNILTASNIKYLLIIKELSGNQNGVRSTDIAKRLQIKEPSVYTMVKALQNLKLIKKDRYSVIYFTEQGFQLTKKYLSYFETIRTHLDALLPENSDVKSAACALLAEIPENDIEKMCSRLKKKAEMKSMYLEMNEIKKSFGDGDSRTEILRGISCNVEKEAICVLLGPSGSGKSTLLNIIGGIEAADSGTLSIGGEMVGSMNDKQLSLYRRKHLGYVFQSYNLISNLTVKENIEVGAYLSDKPLPLTDLLKTLGLWEHKDKIPSQLSGGQQQRCAIGRAIIKNPDILLCDEPTGALDYKTSKEILKLIEDVNHKFGNTVILVTHNDAIKHMADQVIKLRDGMIRHNDLNTEKISATELDW